MLVSSMGSGKISLAELRFIERVAREAWHLNIFFGERQHLLQERIVDVARTHPVQKTLRHQQRKCSVDGRWLTADGR